MVDSSIELGRVDPSHLQSQSQSQSQDTRTTGREPSSTPRDAHTDGATPGNTSSGRPLTMVSSTATLCDMSDTTNKEGEKGSTPTAEHPAPIPEHELHDVRAEPKAAQQVRPGGSNPTPNANTNGQPQRQPSTTTRRRRASDNVHSRPPPPPAPAADVIGIFDPASVGGGGPLKRIETQRSERYQREAQEAKEKAESEAAGEEKGRQAQAQGVAVGMGTLKRFRSHSASAPGGAGRKRAITISTFLPHSHGHVHEHEEEDEEHQHQHPSDSHEHGHGHGLSRYGLSKYGGSISGLSSGGKSTPGFSSSGKEKTSYDFGGDSPSSPPSPYRDGGGEGDARHWHSGEEIERGEEEEEEEEYVYPDGGYGWVIIGCCATLSGCTMGWGMSNGTFLEYYETVFPSVSSSVLSLPGTANALCMCTAGFFAGRMGDQYGFKRILYISAAIAFIGLFSAAWCTSFWQLIITQGVITGFGQGLSVPMFMALPSQWFYKRRGAASGLAIGGAGLGGGVANLLVRQLLTSLGYRKTFIIMACLNTFVTVISILLIRTRPRSPEARGSGTVGKRPWVDREVVRTSAFWALGLGLICATMGYAMPFNYLSKWVKAELPNEQGLLVVLPVTLMAFSICIGRGLIGIVADLIGPINTFILVFFLSGMLQLAMWETARSFAAIIAFSILFGLVAPGFLGIIPQVVVQIFGSANLATNVGLIWLFNGPGNFVAGPLGGAILDKGGNGGTDFRFVIVASGCLQLLGGVITLWVRYKVSKKLWQRV